MTPVYPADLTVDFINNAAFENTSYKKQEPKVINLFHKEDNIFKKKKKVNVKKYNNEKENENIDDINLTDSEYVKKLKKQENKNVKDQFKVNVNKETPEYNAENTEEYVNESDSIVTVEPRNKKFFRKNKKETRLT